MPKAEYVVNEEKEKDAAASYPHPDETTVKFKYREGSPSGKKGPKGKTTLEKVLIGLVVLFALLFLVFLIAFIVVMVNDEPAAADSAPNADGDGGEGTADDDTEPPCLTPDCVMSASRLLSYMDQSVDPCDDFYQYACGSWEKSQFLDPDEEIKGLAQEVSDRNRVNLRGLLEDKKVSHEPLFKKKLKEFYAACMDINALEQRGTKPFFSTIEKIGDFPAINPAWREADFDLNKIVLEISKLGSMPFFVLTIDRDFKDSTVRRLKIGDASIEVSSPERNDSKTMFYEKFLVDNLVLLGAERTQAEKDMKEAVDLEVEIFKSKRTPIEKQNISSMYNPTTIGEFQSRHPWLNWLEIINGMSKASTGGSVVLNDSDVLIVSEPDFLDKLGVVLGKVSARAKANYLFSNLMLFFADMLGPDFISLKQQYDFDIKGIEGKPRWERCVDEAILFFPESVGRVYVDRFFGKEAKSYMVTMIQDLKGAFAELLKENTWLSDKSKKLADEKLDKMGHKIGYPDYILNDTRLNEIYSSIPTRRDEYMETVVAVLVQFTGLRSNFNVLRHPIDKNMWPVGTAAATVNAINSHLTNEIIFPAAFLQPPSYSPTYSSSMNYGGIGMIIGHEITHGYDTTGSNFDSNGEMKQWWTPQDLNSFFARAQCFVEQYEKYSWGEHSINGQHTLGENIADNGGLKESYRAYRDWVKRRGSEEPKLPGLTLSHNQIFFLSFAQVWCTKARDSAMKHATEKDEHSPGPTRVIGSLQNSHDFAKVFKCPEGSGMNPKKKCELW